MLQYDLRIGLAVCYMLPATKLSVLSTMSDYPFGAIGRGRFMQCAVIIQTTLGLNHQT